jgi:hypothetical protein
MANKEGINIGLGFDTSGFAKGMATVADGLSGIPKKAKPVKTAIDELNIAYRQTLKDAQNIALSYGATSTAFQDAADKAKNLRNQIDGVNTAIQAQTGQQAPIFQRSQQGFSGLSNSINQITREMPAFTYSMQTGFMAVANNIPILIDEIGRLKVANKQLVESGQPTKSVFSAIASSVFSLQTAMGVGLTILTVYGAEMVKFAVSLFDANKELAEQEKRLQDVYVAQQNVNAAVEIWTSIYGEGLKGKDKDIFDAKQSFYKREKELVGQLTHLQLEGVKKYDAAYTALSYAIQNNIQNLHTALSQIEAKYTQVTAKVNIQGVATISTKPIAGGDIASRANDAMQNIIDKQLGSRWAEINAKNLKGMAEWKANWAGLIETTEKGVYDISNLVAGVLVDSFNLLGETIAKVFSGTADGGELFKSIGMILVNFMKALGTAMITAGVASEAFKVLFATGLPAIAAGGALLAAAGVVGGLLNSTTSGGSVNRGMSGSYSGGYGGGGYMGQNYSPESIQVGGIVRGSDLQIVLVNANNQTRRVR